MSWSKAMNSLIEIFAPSSEPNTRQSCQPSTPISQATGENTQPKTSRSVRPPAAQPSRWSASVISPMKAISIAITFSHSFRPSVVPLAAASITLFAVRSMRRCTCLPVADSSVSGSMIFAITKAAGALITDAVKRCGPYSGPSSPM